MIFLRHHHVPITVKTVSRHMLNGYWYQSVIFYTWKLAIKGSKDMHLLDFKSRIGKSNPTASSTWCLWASPQSSDFTNFATCNINQATITRFIHDMHMSLCPPPSPLPGKMNCDNCMTHVLCGSGVHVFTITVPKQQISQSCQLELVAKCNTSWLA